MLNFNRNDRLPDPKDPKLPARPATTPASGLSTPAATPPTTTSSTSASTTRPPATATPATTAPPTPAPAATSTGVSTANDAPGSRLSIGPNINLKGVEISNCDVLVIEGNVDATITSKVMEIAPPGQFSGTANIDIAEIHGEFSGELTVRTKLVVHGTGRVTGTIRYGKLVVAEGGVLSGELKQLEAPEDAKSGGQPVPRPLLNPQPH
jgi:cytoskeletal protein CcmA (bactofilin family)